MGIPNRKEGEYIVAITIILSLAFAMALSLMVSAAPQGAGYDEGSSETNTTTSAGNDAATGGYISEANLSVTSQTSKWQGYYGNVSGYVALADATGNEMYNWTWAVANGGEVFAVARVAVPIFTDVDTKDITAGDADTALTTGGTPTWSATGSDSVALTFSTDNDNSGFIVSGQTVAANSRNSAHTLKSSGGNSAFEEVLLTDLDTFDDVSDMIWTCLISNDAENFKGTTSDYQMIVPTTDSGGDTTTYYFYVELT
jgi:hypothetical protein